MLRNKHAGQWEELGSQLGENPEPRLSTKLGHQRGSELQDPKSEGRGHPHFYLSCACTEEMSVPSWT